ncbi:MAG: endolytic transglycosylase MltG [Bacteroidetes bacterium]|nr:endolytic transglycosylase MltG [Bacteroidota bacterium]
MRIKLFLLLLLGSSSILLAWVGWGLFGPTLSNHKKFLYVAAPTPRLPLLALAQKNDELQTTFWLNHLLKWWHVDTIRAGRYRLSASTSVFQLARNLKNGNQSYVKLSINKIRTLEELAGRIGNGIDSKTDSLQLLHYFKSNDSIQLFGVNTQTLLALALPYTYEIGWADDPATITGRFYKRWKQYWVAEKIQQAREKGLTPLEVSILASIVEEETNNKEDRFLIASTYLNRLRIGMKLQADPTAKYASRDYTLNRILYQHLAVNSPYNTYLHTGLPPGPICTPSLQAIDAVLDAPTTNYLFFVASWKFDGKTLFSSTYKEHQTYVNLFHAAQRKRLE